MLQDVAVLTGGQVISEEVGFKIEKVVLKEIGQAKRVVIDKDNTTIVDGAGKQADIQGRIKAIKQQIETTTSDYDKEKLQERLAKLAVGFAFINFCAATETDHCESCTTHRSSRSTVGFATATLELSNRSSAASIPASAVSQGSGARKAVASVLARGSSADPAKASRNASSSRATGVKP